MTKKCVCLCVCVCVCVLCLCVLLWCLAVMTGQAVNCVGEELLVSYTFDFTVFLLEVRVDPLVAFLGHLIWVLKMSVLVRSFTLIIL